MVTEADLDAQVGKDGNVAKADLAVKYPNMQIDILCVGDMVTMDYRLDRLRVWCDPATMKVSSVSNG